MSTEKNFAKGFIFKRNANAPGFVVGNISVKVDEAIAWLQANQSNGWANLKVNQAQNGNYYIELDTWQPKSGGQTPPAKKEEVNHDFWDL
jgi:hypothetical protein